MSVEHKIQRRGAPEKGCPSTPHTVATDVEQKLQKLLDKAGVKYFKAYEFLTKGGSHHSKRSGAYGLNTNPPENLLPNIIPTALVLDRARECLGHPIILSSTYRSAKYNAAVGGASQSLHKKFVACDCLSYSPPALYKVLCDLRAEGVFSGGIGGYSGFIHVDTRGYNATWGIKY